ncbi:MAG: MraY family glycosyltransferase [Lysobacterales bacterium]
MQPLPIAVLLAFATSWGMTLVLRRFAAALGLLDHPGGHKQHADPVPAVGGIAIALGLLAGLGWLGVATMAAFGAVLAAAAILLLVGLADDRRGLSPRLRFLVQALAAVVMAAGGGILLHDFGTLLDGHTLLSLGWLAWPLTVFCVVGLINACNMSDGHDGVAGSQVALALLATGVLLAWEGSLGRLAAVLLSAVVGFLFWNAPWRGAARAYLGDAGSLLLGGLLAALLVTSSQGAGRGFEPVVALWLYALPLIDTVSVMWRRHAAGLPMFAPDQRHLHHLLTRLGLGPRAVWLAITAIALVFAVVGVAAARCHWPAPLLAIAFVLLALGYHALMRRIEARWPRCCG